MKLSEEVGYLLMWKLHVRFMLFVVQKLNSSPTDAKLEQDLQRLLKEL